MFGTAPLIEMIAVKIGTIYEISMIRQQVAALFASFLFAINSIAAQEPTTTPCYQAAVSSSQPLATQIGLDILSKGGNAVDAAVAIGYALAVVEPCCGNLGGGGFMLIRLQDEPAQTHFINFREKAPAKLTSDLFFNAQGEFQSQLARRGYLSAGIPGTVMGLNTALEKFGSLPLKTVINPAIKLAKHGFTLHDTHAKLLENAAPALSQDSNAKKVFIRDGKPHQAGQRLIQPQLASTLTTIAKKGTAAFYQGDIAEKIVASSNKHHGVMTLDDFKKYTVSFEQPVTCHYRGYDIITSPPPSGGGIALCEMLKILEKYEISCNQCPPSTRIHLMIEAMRYSFADRNHHLGDPVFVNNPIDKLLSAEHINDIEKSIRLRQATPSELICPQQKMPQQQPSKETANTTHYSVIDKHGNAVSVTYSLNSYFGAKVMPDNTGFLLNNHINDFTIIKGQRNIYDLQTGSRNILTGTKRPLSSMAPTLLLKDGQLKLILGTPGGPTIITTLLQTLVKYLDQDMSLQTAIDKPRFHMQCQPNTVFMEANVFSPEVAKQLQAMGHHLQQGSIYHTEEWGAVAAIEVETKATADGEKAQICYRPVIDRRRPDGQVGGLTG